MTEAEHSAIAGRSILLYDGVCGLCNRLVRLILRIDRVAALKFTPLESPLALELLALFPPAADEPEGIILITAVFTSRMAVYRRFEAIREMFRRLPGLWPMVGALLGLVPRPLRESSYGIIARNRYRLFGKFDTCPVPTEAQRSRILGM